MLHVRRVVFLHYNVPIVSDPPPKLPVVLSDADVGAEAVDRLAEWRVDADVLLVTDGVQCRVVDKVDPHGMSGEWDVVCS